MEWKPYVNSSGEHAELSGLILTAWHTGAWSCHDPSGKILSRSSQMIVRPVVGGIETGKRLAEENAREMLKST